MKGLVFGAAAIVATVALLCACPLGMMAHAQMTDMMQDATDAANTTTTCPLLCGVPSWPTGVDANGFVLGPFPVQPASHPMPVIRPIFHPPTLP
jgi:ABC-type phosphate transport system permease subunit